MVFFDVLHSLLVGVLMGYLSFTNSLAFEIQKHFPSPEQAPITPKEVAMNAPSTELTLLSRLYATTEGITSILRNDAAFQAALSSASGDPEALTTSGSRIDEATIIESLVNILCEYSTEEYTRTTTGTGFFIHENGVILTNAHVAQFLLLRGVDERVHDASCTIRSGNPAAPRYHAELLFISPTWIFNNAKLISEELPRGTGEYDYALLYVSKPIDETISLPVRFPALPLHTDFLSKSLTGAVVQSAGYPAERLFREGARALLTPTVASTTIDELYTFGSNYADIFSLASSPVGEHGASGGPVVARDLGAIGLIVTKGDTENDGKKSLRALTLSYVDRSITEETGFSLRANLVGDLSYRSAVFTDALAPFLSKLLSYELQ